MAAQTSASASASAVILAKLGEIEELQIGDFREVKEAIARLAKLVGELKESVGLISEAQASTMTSAIAAAASGRPSADGDGSKRKTIKINQAVNARSMEITARPLKCVSTSNPLTYTLNTQTVCSVLFALVLFEKDYKGSADAVVDLLMSCIVGFENGFAPIKWDSKSGDVRYLTARNLKAPLTRVVRAVLDITDQLDSKAISDLQKAMLSPLATKTIGSPLPSLYLAALFQSSFTRSSTPYHPSSNGSGVKTANKLSFPNSFLGLAWHARLPHETQVELGFPVYDPTTPIPLFQLMDKAGNPLPAPPTSPVTLAVQSAMLMPPVQDDVSDTNTGTDESSVL